MVNKVKRMFLGLIILMFLGSGLAYAGDYALSAHGNSSSGVSGRLSGYGTGNCAHCHEQHASVGGVPTGPNPALIFSAEEATCLFCHDGDPVSPSMDFSGKAYKHPTFVASKHTLSILEYGLSGTPFRTTVTTPITRHAECVDCHEPHTVQSGTHQLFYGENTDGADNNLVSGVLKGVWGVTPSSESTWGTANVSYTENKPATMEYQICFKCHSYYAINDPDGVTTLTGPSGEFITDQAMEFSSANKSAHPVKVGLSSQTGSVTPKPLTAAQMKSPWNTTANMGVQTMYCSDCHGNDAASPVGPHGSDKKFMLTGTAKYWPLNNAATPALWTLGDAQNNTNSFSTDCFCTNCHPVYDTSWKNNAHTGNGQHSTAYKCVQCHVGLPHGSNFGRLIADSALGHPYDYNDLSEIDSFTKAGTPTGYSKDDAYCSNLAGDCSASGYH